MSKPANMKIRRPEPSEIQYKNMRFLITDRPTDCTMDKFIQVGGISLLSIFLYGTLGFFIQKEGRKAGDHGNPSETDFRFHGSQLKTNTVKKERYWVIPSQIAPKN